jgi:hypothetical protein
MLLAAGVYHILLQKCALFAENKKCFVYDFCRPKTRENMKALVLANKKN